MKNVRKYGAKPYKIAVVHGGPGAPGEMAPVARELAKICGVLEPLQTKATLEGQVRELHEILEQNGELPICLIGYSWGAWLSFIVTARHPEAVRKLILVGSAAFEEKYSENIVPDRMDRLTEEERIEAFDLIDTLDDPGTPDKDTRMARLGALFNKADTYDALPQKSELLEFSYEINKSVWEEAKALRESGGLLDMGKKIKCPVVAIHGDYDPHRAEGVREPLSGVLKDFKFILLEKCGHEPWIEKFARDKFYEILRNEIK